MTAKRATTPPVPAKRKAAPKAKPKAVPKRGRGRPTKFTPETCTKIVNAIAAGNFYEPACIYAGVDYATFRRWIEKGEAEESGDYRDFCEQVMAAEAKAEVGTVARWQQHMPESWQACRDFLARRFPDRWRPVEEKRLAGPDGEALPNAIAILKVSADDL